MHANLSDHHKLLSNAEPNRLPTTIVELVRAEQNIALLKLNVRESDLRLLRLSAENLKLGDALDKALRAKDALAERISRLEHLLSKTNNQYLNSSEEIHKAIAAKKRAEDKINALESSARMLEAEHRAVLMSRCWRATAPVRAIIEFIQRG